MLIIGHINSSLTSVEGCPRNKIYRPTEVLNDMVDQLDLIDIYRTLQPQTAEHTFKLAEHAPILVPVSTLSAADTCSSKGS